jgi:hypothetical protein
MSALRADEGFAFDCLPGLSVAAVRLNRPARRAPLSGAFGLSGTTFSVIHLTACSKSILPSSRTGMPDFAYWLTRGRETPKEMASPAFEMIVIAYVLELVL